MRGTVRVDGVFIPTVPGNRLPILWWGSAFILDKFLETSTLEIPEKKINKN